MTLTTTLDFVAYGFGLAVIATGISLLGIAALVGTLQTITYGISVWRKR